MANGSRARQPRRTRGQEACPNQQAQRHRAACQPAADGRGGDAPAAAEFQAPGPAPAAATAEVEGGVTPPPAESTPWQKYSSIETSTTPKVLRDFQRLAAGACCEWVACEKVHGANFSFVADGEGVAHASRNMRYHPYVLQAFEIARRAKPELESMVIYGEYFGGYFPDLQDPQRRRCGGLKTVQRGVAYSPDHHFYAFDVSLNGTGYLDFDDARSLLIEAGFPLVASPLVRGTFEEAYGIDVEKLHTGLPALLGLPPPSSFYVAEGVVIRPVRELVRGGSGGGRALLKKKARAFWEATNQKDMAATQVPASLSDGGAVVTTGQEVLLEARNFLTSNRLDAVISKDPGLLRPGRESELAQALAEDALEDFLRHRDGEAEPRLGEEPHLRARLEEFAKTVIQARLVALRADHA